MAIPVRTAIPVCFSNVFLGIGKTEKLGVLLVIDGRGKGGCLGNWRRRREHALCHALRIPFFVMLFSVHSGNAGISSSGDATCISDLDVLDSSAVIAFCQAAALEGSKNFMKSLCDKYGIAKYQAFTDPSAAKEYIKQEGAPIVVKADGLAAGKGVIVAMTLEQAYEAVDSMLVDNVFGSAGPNTGGMGAYSPAPVLTKELQSVVMESIILPTVKGMAEEGCKFVGVLYAGLMIEKVSGLPKLIEYNVRFGDPECQVLMVRLESDLVEILLAACHGKLHGMSLDWSPGSAMVVVMASKGYPGSYQKGTIIHKLEEAEQVASSVKVFHAGTAFDADGNFIATGMVLGVTAKGKDLEEARDREAFISR
ncbi:Phosphoribosylamine--glycine ligase, chloroplastic [Datura stramonium]|uniref:Glycinamide ribonucleotide synthetase n=1 Tax=Datura stramonium TaxID=4076 RepID=A0ABS8UT40_DATST|nr:Phosphoribosylamine--glycine ligase, chloroplastic [Datura stramonium]